MNGPLKRETLGQSRLVLLAAVGLEPGAAEALGGAGVVGHTS